MKTRRFMGVAALGAVAASLLLAPAAHAQQQPTVTYGAGSDGRALAINLFGQGLTAGMTHTEASSNREGIDGPVAVATGAGIANPVSPVGQSAAGAPDGALPEGMTATEGEQCAGALPAELAQLGLAADFACSTSSAALTDGSPSASSTSRVASLQLNPVNAINQTPLAEVVEGLETEAIDPLLEGLAPVFQGIDEGTGLTTEDTLNDLFELLLNGAPLATVTVGATASTTTATAAQVVTECTAEGARIDVLDPAGVEGVEGIDADAPPVLSVIVGNASTSITTDLTTGQATAAATPALATIIAPLLGPENQRIDVGPGGAQTIPLPAPFGNVIVSAAGTTEGQTEDGATTIQASAVRVHLFEGSEDLMNGIEVAFADCASVAGATVTAAVPELAREDPPALPRTGSESTDGLALAAVIGIAGLGVTVLRRHTATV
jgi:LPXTG-motif cell wall-anchored protein